MTFATPEYAYILFVLPLLALLKIAADRRAQRAVAAFASSERLRNSLLGGASPVWSGLHFGLQLLGLGFIIISMTRPQYGREENDIPQTGRSIFIAIDCSKSMLADDMSPNRLTRAKLAAQDLLEKLSGDRIGLIAFAGRAFLQAPLTTDHEAVRETIQSLDHTSIPRGGSSLAAAIETAIQTMEKSPTQRCGLIIFSDGQETDNGTLAAAKKAAEKHILILPVGMGTVEGSLIPDPDPEHRGDWVRDANGVPVRAKLEADLLMETAKVTGGKYIELATEALSYQAVAGLLAQLDRQNSDSRQESKPIERYQWPLCLGIVCLILSMIMRPSSRKLVRAPALPVDPQAEVHHPLRTATVLIVLGFVPLLVSASKEPPFEKLQRAQKAYEEKHYDVARDAYTDALKQEKPATSREELAYGLGAAQLQLKDFEGSAKSFSDALQSDDTSVQKRALRGLGTSLYEIGGKRLQAEPDSTIKAWTDSRDHFTSAMSLMEKNGERDSKEYAELKENRDHVDSLLKELKKRREEEKQQQQQQKGQKKKGQNQPGGSKGDEDKEKSDGNKEEDKDGEAQKDRLKKEEQALPEGQLRAKESGQPEKPQQKQNEGEENKRNEKTGFTPQEALNQLRTYADDHKQAQYLMHPERPLNGKDY